MILILRNTILSYTLLLIASFGSFGQKTYNDFLSEEDIQKKGEIGLYLWNEFLRSDLDSLKIMSVELLLDAAEKKSKFARAVGYFSLGSYLIRVENIESGIHHLKQAGKYFELNGDLTLQSEINNEIGNAYHLLGQHQKAINAYLNSLNAGENAPDQTAAFNAKIGLGKTYCLMGDTALGVITISQYKNEALKFNKFEAAADAYAYLGQIEMDRMNTGLAREHYKKSISFSRKSHSKIHLSHAMNNKAILHFSLNEYDSCLYYFNQSLMIRQELNNLKAVAESYYNIASYYVERGETKAAISYFLLSADVANMKSFRVDERDALIELLSLYKESNREKEAKEVQLRISELDKAISGKKDLDKEIIEYTESIIGNTEMENVVLPETGKSYAFIGILLISIAVLVVLTFFRKRSIRRM